MVAKKKKVPNIIPEAERLKLQLLNSYVDRSKEALEKYMGRLENAKLRLENAQLGIAMAQREVTTAKAELEVFGDTLADKFQFSLVTDSVNWETGEIKRSSPDEGTDES